MTCLAHAITILSRLARSHISSTLEPFSQVAPALDSPDAGPLRHDGLWRQGRPAREKRGPSWPAGPIARLALVGGAMTSPASRFAHVRRGQFKGGKKGLWGQWRQVILLYNLICNLPASRFREINRQNREQKKLIQIDRFLARAAPYKILSIF